MEKFNPEDGFLFDLYFHPNVSESDYEKLREDIGNSKSIGCRYKVAADTPEGD
jgi:hypothetical protein